MKAIRIAIVMSILTLPQHVSAAEHYIMTTIGVCNTWGCLQPGAAPAWDSGAWVESRFLGFPYVIGMRNSHNVYEDNNILVNTRTDRGYWSDWQSYLEGGPQSGHCYNAHLY